MFGQVTAALNGKKVMRTKTGWPSVGGNFKRAFALKGNAMRYFINTQEWAEQEKIKILIP